MDGCRGCPRCPAVSYTAQVSTDIACRIELLNVWTLGPGHLRNALVFSSVYFISGIWCSCLNITRRQSVISDDWFSTVVRSGAQQPKSGLPSEGLQPSKVCLGFVIQIRIACGATSSKQQKPSNSSRKWWSARGGSHARWHTV